MPKIKPSKSCNLRQIVSEFGDVFSTDGEVLFCKMCETKEKTSSRTRKTRGTVSASAIKNNTDTRTGMTKVINEKEEILRIV